MNKLQKLLCLLLSLLLLTQAPLLALAEDEPADEPEAAAAQEQEEIEFPEELIVGHPTVTKGDFFTELFGNDTADIDVRALIHGYNLVNWDQNQGVYVMDPSVVVDYTAGWDEDGNKTYSILLADDLKYSDGTPITAWDYAFSILLMMSPEIEEIGGKIYRAEHLLGYDDYIKTRKKIVNGEALDFSDSPEADVFSLGGVNVISDHQMQITLDHDFLPYFFELGLLMTVPYPIDVIAPGCKVYDDGNGIYIGNANNTGNYEDHFTHPVYTAELLQKTILDPENGYNSHPSVVSGPYKMVSWDPQTGEGHFEKNEYFKGAWIHNNLPGPDYSGPVTYVHVLDEEGNPKKDTSGEEIWLVIPTIEKICFKVADNDTMIQQLADGELHLVNKVTYGPTINEGIKMDGVAAQAGVQSQNYPRIGLSFLTFTYDWPTVHEEKVRQAIAWCMDRDLLTSEYCGYTNTIGDTQIKNSFGFVVNGYYGIEQWEYLLLTGQVEYPVNFIDDMTGMTDEEKEELLKKYKYRYVKTQEDFETAVDAWKVLSEEWNGALVRYTVDLAQANRLLDEAGWILNRNGDPYQAGVDDVRCKKIDDQIVALDLKMMYPEGNHMAEIMQNAVRTEESVQIPQDAIGPDPDAGTFIENLAKVGIKLELVPEPMEELLKSYYRQKERTTDMIYLATNFHVVVDPSITYSSEDPEIHQIWNNTFSDDEQLYYCAKNMRETEPGNIFEFVSEWVSFQKRYNEVLPAIPIYSNIYFDFLNEHLQNYWITGQVTWSQAILPAYFGLAPEPAAPEEAEGEENEDTESFDE